MPQAGDSGQMKALALTAILAAPVAAIPVEEHGVQRHVVRAELERTESSLEYENLSDSWQLLLFGSHELGVMRSLRIGPGKSLSLPCSPEADEGLLLEVIHVDASGLASSGAIWLESLDYVEHGRAVLASEPGGTPGLVTWVAVDGEAVRGATSRTLVLGQRTLNLRPGVMDVPGIIEINVPVITPRPAGNNAPIKRIPLPPA